ncbi:DUF2272 domain-containing protein [Lysobacter sp. A3-1-A15]|uniref:DUF2272 domain-containing protein n=1 Tax=Novilysobacter viscosus TaxID=3098602 RepID=UPI002ED8DED8
MQHARWLGLPVALAVLALWPVAASAGCTSTDPLQARDLPSRIASVACREHALWFQPFIDAQGRLASTTVAEAEDTRLADGSTPAWLRVVDYWQGSGLLGSMAFAPGASTCAYARRGGGPIPGCRTFVVDKPWSAAFMSYVMVQAGVPGFRPSPGHVDYVREAYQRPESSPYTAQDPRTARPEVGDLLCYVRGTGAGADSHPALSAWFTRNPGASLAMHCEVVVQAGRGGQAHLIGGNVLQAVTMRILPLNRDGRFWGLPQGDTANCSPANPAACDFNRKHWATLLKLKPGLPMGPSRAFVPQAAPLPQACCVNCVVGSGVPRCSAPATGD